MAMQALHTSCIQAQLTGPLTANMHACLFSLCVCLFAWLKAPFGVQGCTCLRDFRPVYSPAGILFCQPYKRPNLAAIVPACVLGVIVLGLLCVSVGLYWRHQHRISAAAHAKVRGPPGRPPVPEYAMAF